MTLDEIVLINYRSWNKIHSTFLPNEPQILIGLNDCGKSTILHALDLLLGDKPKYFSKSEGKNKTDLSNSVLSLDEFQEFFKSIEIPQFVYTGNETVIIGKLFFTDEELNTFYDKTLSPSLMWAIENSCENEIWIAKIYNNTSINMQLLLKDSEENNEYWNKGATELKSIIKEKGISADEIKNENGKGRFSNFEQIRAIYKKEKKLIYKWVDYKFAKSDKEVFPIFKYYDWNCSFEDINSIANSIMHEHIQAHIKPIRESALKAAEDAEKTINAEFSKLSLEIKKIAKGVNNIKSKVFFDVKETISDIMVNKDNSDGDIHLELQGAGLKRQIWFSLIKAKADQGKVENYNQFIWAFDEPETHLYPGAQRELFEVIKKLSLGNVQTIICTHSTVFIDKSKISSIYSVELNEKGYSDLNKCTDIDDIYNSLSVRNSDFLFYDKFLIVEGDPEQYLIPKLYELFTGSSLVNDNIQLINIQGKDKWKTNKEIIEKIMKGFKKSEESIIYLFDYDMSYKIGVPARTDKMFFVGIQDIEDSIDDTIWVEIVKHKTDGVVNFDKEKIEEIKKTLPKDREGNNNEKFYKILQKETRLKYSELKKEEINYDVLPSKGIESSELILKFLNSKDLIPLKIIAAFKKLN